MRKDRIVTPEAVPRRGSGGHRRLVVREGDEQADNRRAARLGRRQRRPRDRIYEIKSTYILQPGPASLTEGVTRLHACIRAGGTHPTDSSVVSYGFS